MGGELRRAIAVARTTVSVARAKNVPFMAGSVAYNAFVSLVPLLVLLLVVVAAVGDQELAEGVVRLTDAYLTPSGQAVVLDALQNASGRTGLSAVGLLVLVWGALRLFRGVDIAFSELYGTESENTLVNQLADALVAVTVLVLAMVAAVLASTAFVVADGPVLGLLNPLVLVLTLALAFLPIYYLFPDVEMRVTEAVPGAVVAAVGWGLLEGLFQVYALAAGRYEAYGLLGGVLLLVTWLYLAGLSLLLGAVVNAVLAGRLQDSEPGGTTDGTVAGPRDATCGDSVGSQSATEPPTTGASPRGRDAIARPGDGPSRRRRDSAVEREDGSLRGPLYVVGAGVALVCAGSALLVYRLRRRLARRR